MTWKTRGPWLLAAGAVLALAFAFRHDVGPLLHLLDTTVREAGPGAPVALALVIGLWGTLCLPGPVILAAAGALFSSRPLLAVATVMAGDTLAQALAFLVARHLARERVRGWFQWLEKQTRERGAAAVLSTRLMAFFPNALASYAFGLMPLEFGPYLAASFAGTLLPTSLFVLGSTGIVHLLKNPVFEHDLLVALGLAALVFAGNLALSRRGWRG